MNPSILYFSRLGNAIKALILIACAALCFYISYAMLAEQTAPPDRQFVASGGLVLPESQPRPDPFSSLRIVLLLGGGFACTVFAIRCVARAATREVAVKIESGRIHFHPSYLSIPDDLRVDDVLAVIVDRADRLPNSNPPGNWGARLGARLRYGLYLRYRTARSDGEIRLVDNDIDGGAEQLRRFAAQVELWRKSRVRTAGRT